MAFLVICSVSLLLMVACKKKEAPRAPSGVNAYVSGSTIKVSWNSVEDADSYTVTDGDGYSLGETYSTSYTDYSPDEGSNYYRVYARNDYGRSSSYGSASCYYHDDNGGGNGGGGGGGNAVPSIPTGVSAEVSGSKLRVSWNSVSNATSYKVYWSETGNSYTFTIGTTTDTYIYDDVPYEDNYYKVKAINDYGESELSSSAYCHYSSGGGGGGGGGGTTVPNAPTGVTAVNTGPVQYPSICISWNAVSNATSYKVYRSTSASGSYSQIGSETSYTTLYDDNPKQGYNYYKVKAFNSAGSSSYSSYAMYNHDPSSQLSPCPVHYTGHTATSSTITLRWSNPTTSGCGTPTKAYLRVRHPDLGDYVDLQTLSGSATSASFNYLLYVHSDGWVYCGIITENSAGTSGGLPMVYNVNTGTWYGGNGKQYTEMMENEEFVFSALKH